jgi:hypothetical protein
MRCNVCGHDGAWVSAGTRRPSSPGRPAAEPADVYCERCGTPLPADESAALFLAMLKMLGRFGLATHTQLLLGTSREDG